MAHETARDRGHRMLREAGYASGGDVAQDKRMVTKAIRQHETQEHGGKHSKLKLAKGGPVQKRADGGAIRKPAITANVIVAAGGKGQGASDESAMRKSIQGGMHAAPPAIAPAPPPMGGPGMGAGLPPGIGGGAPTIAPPAMAGAPLGAGPMPGAPPRFQKGGVIPGAPYQRRRGGKAGC